MVCGSFLNLIAEWEENSWYNSSQHNYGTIEYKLILLMLIDSEQMLLSIEVQLCTRRGCIVTDEGLRG